eukprot:scaffold4732_cov100-Skeletonema_marinoi.AAC.5
MHDTNGNIQSYVVLMNCSFDNVSAGLRAKRMCNGALPSPSITQQAAELTRAYVHVRTSAGIKSPNGWTHNKAPTQQSN